MSSAILYVAIVAIWAGVLIPRWLRRDSSSSEPAGDSAGEDLSTAKSDSAAPGEEPVARPRRQDPAPVAHATPRAEGGLQARTGTRREARAEARTEARTRAEARPEAAEARREASRGEPRGGPPDQEHKRVLSARRRLLGMLLMLAIGSGALAFTKLAAWWVVVPPSVMLLSYMALLREAAKADAEQRDLARTRAVRTVAAAPPVAVPTAAPPAPAPGAEVIDLSASLGPAGEEFYDQYADAKLRAVGDLARALAS